MPAPSQHVLHFMKSANGAGLPSWEKALMERELVVLRVRTLDQAKFYVKSYPLLAVIIDLEGEADAISREIAEIVAAENGKGMPILGLHARPFSQDEQARFGAAGLSVLLDTNFPSQFLAFQLESLRAARGCGSGGAAASGAQNLADEGRQLLHDVSQPLAALQGRLQILDSKIAEDDPLKKSVHDMAGLAVMVSDRLRELHDLHRRHS